MKLGLALAASLLACAHARPGHARVAIRCDEPGALLTVDGVPHGEARDYDGGHRLLLDPGSHVLELRGHGALETRRLTLGAGDDITLNIAFAAPGADASQGEHR